MVGFEVTPTTPSSIMRSRLPLSISSRERESIQTLCPISCNFRKRSFTRNLLGSLTRPSAVRLNSLQRAIDLRMALLWGRILDRRGTGSLLHPLGPTEELERLVS